MDFEELKERIKEHEGFRNKVYLDHLGNRTIGYGHLCLPNEKWDDDKIYDSKELNKTFEYDFNIACKDAEKLIAKDSIHPDAFGCLVNLTFNIGFPRASKFVKMLAALKKQEYKIAAKEILDSRYANQVPNRARELSEILEKC